MSGVAKFQKKSRGDSFTLDVSIVTPVRGLGHRVILNYGELDGLKLMKYYLPDNANPKLVTIS